MFRYASRRFGLTLFIAAAVDTPRCVPTPLPPPVLSRSPPSLTIASLSPSSSPSPTLPISLSLFLYFLLFMCSPAGSFRSHSLQHTLMHIYIYRLLARRLTRIAASAPDAHDSTLVPMLSTSASAPPSPLLYPWVCLFTAAAQFLVIYTSRASRPASVPSSSYAGIAKFFRRSNVASTMLQTI